MAASQSSVGRGAAALVGIASVLIFEGEGLKLEAKPYSWKSRS